jgi:hypothetical protein
MEEKSNTQVKSGLSQMRNRLIKQAFNAPLHLRVDLYAIR